MLLPVGRPLIGATAPTTARTRRSTAVAGKIPASSPPPPWWRDATSLRLPPAQSRLAVPTREHQSGGPLIHAAPTRSWPTPPGHPRQPSPTTTQYPELLTGGSHLTAPFHIRKSNGAPTWWVPNPEALLRLAGAVLVEAHDEWQVSDRRYLSEASMALLTATTKEVAPAQLMPA
jgi:hypothetical protein